MNTAGISSTASRRDIPVLPLPGITYAPSPPLASHYLVFPREDADDGADEGEGRP